MKNKEKNIRFAKYTYLIVFFVAYVLIIPFYKTPITFIDEFIFDFDDFIQLKFGKKIAVSVFFIPHLIALLLLLKEIKSANLKNQILLLLFMSVLFTITIFATIYCLLIRLMFLGNGPFENLQF